MSEDNKNNISLDESLQLTNSIEIVGNPDDYLFLTQNIPKFDKLNDEEIELLTASLPVIKDCTKEEIDKLIEAIPSLNIEDIERLKEAIQIKDNKTNFDKILELFKSKKSKILLILGALIISITTISITKSLALQDKVDEYENYFFEIDSKESTNIEIYSSKSQETESLDDSKASKVVACMQNATSYDELPESVTSVIKEINDYYNESINRFAFKYVDIYTGFSVSYNENQRIFTASTIKAPVDIYIYEKASIGEIDLDEELLYTERFYSDGSGVLKQGATNTYHTVRELVHHSAYHSDNAAHAMLMNRYSKKDMLEFWQSKGTEAIFTQPNIWGETNAHDAAIYMSELYNFYKEDNEYSRELMSYFFDNDFGFFTPPDGVKTANKSGCSGSAMHDVSIVFDENPYILVGLSNLGCLNAGSYFDDVSSLSYRLHKAYWEYKMNTCIK